MITPKVVGFAIRLPQSGNIKIIVTCGPIVSRLIDKYITARYKDLDHTWVNLTFEQANEFMLNTDHCFSPDSFKIPNNKVIE